MVLGPLDFTTTIAPQPDHVGMGALGISVGVKIPKPVLDLVKNVNEQKGNIPLYAGEVQTQIKRATESLDAINIGAQTIAVAGVFAVVIGALLLREKKGK